MGLTLFIIIGLIAIISAAMMLISENAVYSALFLILNFACIAFFFLMLNAVFLAMAQIAVYTGAIMVLFLFVIMLLGAERVPTGEPLRLRWLTPIAVVLAVAFLVTISAAIIGGDIELTEPKNVAPRVRVVNVLDGVEAVDVYTDGDLLAADVAFGESGDFEKREIGDVALAVFEAGADPSAAEPLLEQTMALVSEDVVSLTLIGDLEAPLVVAAREDVAHNDETHHLRVTVVNALASRDAVDVLNEDAQSVLVQDLGYGEASDSLSIDSSTHVIGVYPPGDTQGQLAALEDVDLKADTSVLVVFLEKRLPDNSFVDVVVNLVTETLPPFGSPAHVGQLLFSKYVLPFEMVALLLLVAMIGAIVLTHESLKPRREVVRQLASPPAGLDQPIIGKSGE